MVIDRNVYNIPKVEAGSVTASTKTKVGTEAEYWQLVNMIEKSGLMIVGITLSGNRMKGSVMANHFAGDGNEGIDFGGVTNFGGSPNIIAGTLELDDDGFCYVTVAVVPVTTNRTTKKQD